MNIQTDDKCMQEFENLKFRKTQTRFIVFVIKDQKIVVENVGARAETWQSFIESLPENEYRYAVFDFQFTNHDNMSLSKLIFISWNPDSGSLKNRVLYATAKQNFKKYLDMHTWHFSLSSKADMTRNDMIKELQK